MANNNQRAPSGGNPFDFNMKSNPNPQQNRNNNQQQGNANPYANMFGNSELFQPQPLHKVILRWVKIISFLTLFVSLIQGCFFTGSLGSGVSAGDFTISKAWEEGFLFGVIFFWPLYHFMNQLVNLYSGMGAELSLFITILTAAVVVKGSALALTWKATLQQVKMQAMQGKMAEIKAKYAGRTDPQARQQQMMETMALYKKENISMLGAFKPMLFTIPIFISMYRVISNAVLFKEGTLRGWSYSDSVFQDISNAMKEPLVLALAVAAAIVQVVSIILPQKLAAARQKKNRKLDPRALEQMQKQQKMMIIIALVMIFVVSSLPLGLTIYWLFTGSWQIGQALFVQRFIWNKTKKKSV